MPRINAVLERLNQRGSATNITLLSIDENPQQLADFLRAQPAGGIRDGRVVRIRSADSFDAWAQTLGLDSSGSGLPFHLLAEPNGAIVCVHSGELGDNDVLEVSNLLGRLATAHR